jgi:hypothetical protein
MPTATHDTGRTAHLLALMRKGDDAFNTRDRAGMDAMHHPDLVAHLTGSAEPLRGRSAHAAAMQQMVHSFPDVHVDNDPYPVGFDSGDWTTVVTRATGTFTGAITLPDGPRSHRPERPSTSTSARSRDGTATSWSRSSSSGTPPCRHSSSAWPANP